MIRKANLSLNPIANVKLASLRYIFLGHTLQKDTIKPHTETVGRILDTDRPKIKKACRILLGMINFYRWYIPSCADVGLISLIL